MRWPASNIPQTGVLSKFDSFRRLVYGNLPKTQLFRGTSPDTVPETGHAILF
jgi:hypothetical protein